MSSSATIRSTGPELFYPESGLTSGLCCVPAYFFARSSITVCDSGGVSIGTN